MTYTTFLGKTYEDEHDEELTRKFGDTYNYFKKEYPGLHKLPTEEVEGIYSEFKKSPYGDTFEKSVDRTKQYINQRMPQWQKQYINSKPKQEQSLRGLQTQKQQSGEQTQQSDPWLEQRRRQAENNLLMNGMDTLYGMNRAVNGMTFGGLDWLGNKIGFDSQMKEYLNLKDPENRNLAQTAGNIAQLGGAMLTGGTLAKAGYDQANMAYNGYKIGKKYDELIKDPYLGSGKDVIARMKNHNGEPVVLQRGEAIKGENGNVIVHGKPLKRETGTVQNFGLDKGIYRHDISRADAQRIPRIIKEKPVKTTEFGQNVYMTKGTEGELLVVTSPTDSGMTVSSMYYPTE